MYCDPTAPSSSAAGRSSAIARARFAGRHGAEGTEPAATASLMLLARLLGTAAAGRDRRRGSEALQRVQRVIELEVLYPLLLQLVRSRGEARIRRVVAFEQLLVDRVLCQQVLAKIRLAYELAILIVGVAE